MEDIYGLYSQGSRALRSMRNGDFQEQNVWDTLNEREDYSSMVGSSSESSIFSPRRLPSAARMIPRAHSNSNPIHEPSRVVQQSAPVKIPDWSKIYGKNSKKASSNNASWLDVNDDEGDGVLNEGDDSDDDDDGDDDVDDVKLPPHEWLAKKYARSQISSFSVFEGVGRKLKGRDLSRVRNAVLTKTGFLE